MLTPAPGGVGQTPALTPLTGCLTLQFEEVFVVIRPDFAKFLRLRRNMGHPQVDYNHLTPTNRGKHLTSAF